MVPENGKFQKIHLPTINFLKLTSENWSSLPDKVHHWSSCNHRDTQKWPKCEVHPRRLTCPLEKGSCSKDTSSSNHQLFKGYSLVFRVSTSPETISVFFLRHWIWMWNPCHSLFCNKKEHHENVIGIQKLKIRVWYPVGSMGLIYLPAWNHENQAVNVGKCIPVPWILWEWDSMIHLWLRWSSVVMRLWVKTVGTSGFGW